MANSPLALTPAPELFCGDPVLVLDEPPDSVEVGVVALPVVFAAVVAFEFVEKVPPNASASGEMLMLLFFAPVEYVSIFSWSGWLTKPNMPVLQWLWLEAFCEQ